MYVMIKHAPTKEQIEQFKTKVTEEDAYINYQVNVSQFDETLRQAFLETFQIDAAVIDGRESVTLTHSVEV